MNKGKVRMELEWAISRLEVDYGMTDKEQKQTSRRLQKVLAALDDDGNSPLFKRGGFKLHSGATTDWKIDCDALTDEDWGTLALMASRMLPPYKDVVGVPRGGLRFAELLYEYCVPDSELPVLVADDVLTTGRSIVKIMDTYPRSVGVVVFARGEIPRRWPERLLVVPMFTFNYPLYLEDR